MSRSLEDLLSLLASGQPSPSHVPQGELLPISEVTVGPLSAAGATEDVGGVEAPAAGLYHARARGHHIVVDLDEMQALRDAGAGFDDGQIE